MNAPAHHPPAIRTTCPYCGVGCGVLAKPDGRGGAVIAADPNHPANLGRLCSKGSALGETLGLESVWTRDRDAPSRIVEDHLIILQHASRQNGFHRDCCLPIWTGPKRSAFGLNQARFHSYFYLPDPKYQWFVLIELQFFEKFFVEYGDRSSEVHKRKSLSESTVRPHKFELSKHPIIVEQERYSSG